MAPYLAYKTKAGLFRGRTRYPRSLLTLQPFDLANSQYWPSDPGRSGSRPSGRLQILVNPLKRGARPIRMPRRSSSSALPLPCRGFRLITHLRLRGLPSLLAGSASRPDVDLPLSIPSSLALPRRSESKRRLHRPAASPAS
jgi:hypothetical protein